VVQARSRRTAERRWPEKLAAGDRPVPQGGRKMPYAARLRPPAGGKGRKRKGWRRSQRHGASNDAVKRTKARPPDRRTHAHKTGPLTERGTPGLKWEGAGAAGRTAGGRSCAQMGEGQERHASGSTPVRKRQPQPEDRPAADDRPRCTGKNHHRPPAQQNPAAAGPAGPRTARRQACCPPRGNWTEAPGHRGPQRDG